MRFAVIHGPNLNLLGSREPDLYGAQTLEEIHGDLDIFADAVGFEVTFFQSNHEGALIDHIQGLKDRCDGIVINAGGLSHTSVSLRDALLAVGLPSVEVHVSNIFKREEFRRTSLLSDAVNCVISGAGTIGYELGLRVLLALT